ncbi:MAG: hypothetical protein JWO72_937 [Caulobacteraceae bacterium]|jgi:hypothetical protein|nr:hypothetical protein [Caulobacteraceae bacterium]
MNPDSPEDPIARTRRSKLVGRIILVVMGLLLLAYIVPTLLNARR